MTTVVFSLPGNERTAEELRINLDAESGKLVLRRFPDGESYLCVESAVAGKTALVVAPLKAPDEKILPLVFLARTLRDLNAKQVILVAPYLPYMRQDRRFRPGEAVTSVYFARLISECFDAPVCPSRIFLPTDCLNSSLYFFKLSFYREFFVLNN